MTKDVKRLYEHFKPKHYKITLDIDTDHNTFTGVVIVNGFKIGRPSQRFTFHQKDLTITAAHITDNSDEDKDVPVERINHHRSYDEVRLHTAANVKSGEYTVRLEFKGKINDQMHGMYPCYFKDGQEDKRLFATQFESHHAREVLPCIDEPEAKATFELTLKTPQDQTVLSNTPIHTQAEEENRLVTTFEKTPHMSTYLLAFVFGDLDYKEASTKSGIAVRTYATKDNVEFTEFALDIAVKCLEFYEDYFGIKYPLQKCDMIALPDFSSGAMENWGCITYREQTLLVDPDNSTLSTRQYVALVVAHELAHQWFGNLVTMKWWTDLWLNEGFASWIEYMAIDKIYPEWGLWTQFIVDEQQQAMKLDALENTHPIEVPVHHPDEIRTIFDAISYSKGSSVINMLHKYLGADDFREGLRHYLAKHKYKNTVTTDLWESLEAASNKPVKDFMGTWTSAAGFPILNVNVEQSHVEISQQRFFVNPANHNSSEQLWPIPLLATDPQLPRTISEGNIKLESTDQNLQFNSDQSGFYRVAYNPSHLEHLGSLIERGKLDTISRIGLVNNLFESAKSGYADTATALHFLRHLKNEHAYPVWDSISSAMAAIRLAMHSEKLREDMKPYVRHLIRTQLDRLGWDARAKDDHFDKLLRPIILGMAASADEPDIVDHCKKLFERIEHVEDVVEQLKTTPSGKQVKRGIDIDPDLRGVVFGTNARLGGQAEFNKLVRLHNESTLTEEKTTLAAAITGFKQKKLYTKALNMIKSPEVRAQDVPYWIAYSFMNRHAKQATWEWLKQNWEWLAETQGNNLSFFRMPIYSARVFNSDEFLADYKKFFTSKMSPSLERSYKQGLEMISFQAEWRDRDFKEIQAFFKSQQV